MFSSKIGRKDGAYQERYLSPAGAAHLVNGYAYSGVDNSILANLIVRHWWNWLIDNVVPVWIAPNMLTLMGLICVICCTLLINVVDIETGQNPGWVFFTQGILVFAYQTFDNLDGKQARKTGSSSALGEAFDHGADSLAIHMWSIFLGNALQLNGSDTLLLFNLLLSVFFLAHWENYFVKQFVLRELSNPTETQLLTVLCLWVTAYTGTDMWKQEADLPIIGLITYGRIVLLSIMIGTVSTFLDHMSTVKENCESKGQPFQTSLLFLTPVCVCLFLFHIWSMMIESIFVEHFIPFIMTGGFIFSYICVRAIVQCVAREPFTVLCRPLYIPLAACINSFININLTEPIIDDTSMLYLCLFVAFAWFSFLAISIIDSFCRTLNIRAFILPGKSNFLPASTIDARSSL
ncbi:CDP-alcohol phosphatidyltransferase [Planoprotostelium fungivorum]|uniref:CDP-alcohol phosphatidyltransferase n=1 Tax=Planoprotostelium fungivorum TaxID=1890364 RepID=A0A2P6NWL9_9EUKA|nr:CDP-alcohol phosphatidyltransferase [Planoprotostelium fungivorum]